VCYIPSFRPFSLLDQPQNDFADNGNVSRRFALFFWHDAERRATLVRLTDSDRACTFHKAAALQWMAVMGRDNGNVGRLETGEVRLSRASVGRFSLYLRHLEAMQREGIHKISSGQLGESLGITDAQVRKDLAWLGNLGQPGIGYSSRELIAAIRHLLGIDRAWSVALVGVGNLGRALLGYRGFEDRGFRVVALFDVDPAKVGQVVDHHPIHALSEMRAVLATTEAELGVIAVPVAAAQAVADALVSAGVKGLLNFAPTVLRVPPEVRIVSVDMTVQLEQLAFLVHTADPD